MTQELLSVQPSVERLAPEVEAQALLTASDGFLKAITDQSLQVGVMYDGAPYSISFHGMTRADEKAGVGSWKVQSEELSAQILREPTNVAGGSGFVYGVDVKEATAASSGYVPASPDQSLKVARVIAEASQHFEAATSQQPEQPTVRRGRLARRLGGLLSRA